MRRNGAVRGWLALGGTILGVGALGGCAASTQPVARPASICGPTSDLKPINAFPGKLGRGVDFARLHKFAVGLLSGSSDDCTGTLVGPSLFLTAGHCVNGTTVGQNVVFNFEYQGDATTPVEPQDPYKITSLAEFGTDLDYAILQLDGSPGERWGWATLRTTAATPNDVLTIIQHPSGAPKEIDVGHLLAVQDTYLTYGDLSTDSGSSGAGIIDAHGSLVGVHTDPGCTATGGYNSGVSLSAAAQRPLIAKLAALTLPFAGRNSARLTLSIKGQPLLLGAALATHAALLTPAAAPAAGVLTQWTAQDLGDGSFALQVADPNGRTAYLDGSTRDGKVQLVDAMDQSTFGTKWRILVTDDGSYEVRVVGDNDQGPRWLSGTPGSDPVGLAPTAGGWSIQAQ